MSAFTLFTRRAALMSGVILGGIVLTACGDKTVQTPANTPQSVPVDVTPVAVTPVKPVNPFTIPDDMTAGASFSAGVAAYKAKDFPRAEAYFKRAASGDLYAADNYLGLIYSADGDMSNPAMAAKHFERALTDAPRLTPLTMLARAYMSGNGVSQDTTTALQYFARVVTVSKNDNAAVKQARAALGEASAEDLATASAREASAITAGGRRPSASLQANVAIALKDLNINVAPR